MNLKQLIYHWCVVMGWHKGLFHTIEKNLETQYYTATDPIKNTHKTVFFMVDGRSIHGGLADRIKGMVSLYALCKKNSWDYKIYFIYPFPLTDYLIPNTYDWTITPNEICYNKKYSSPVLLNSYQLPTSFHQAYLKKRMWKKKQLHVYSESPWAEKQFSTLFHTLFRPTEKLQNDINLNLSNIGSEYISATFRFQQLLGDFKEGNYPILPQNEKNILINKCLNKLQLLHQKHPSYKILVTSDSRTFLTTITKLDYVYIIPGNVVHMDYTDQASFKVYEKSFLDYFLIAHAAKIYLIYNQQMYKSGFAKQAAKLYNRPYKEIKF